MHDTDYTNFICKFKKYKKLQIIEIAENRILSLASNSYNY